MGFSTIDELEEALRGADYLPDRGLSTALFLSLALSKPVLLEGEAGVGKTEAAKALATVLGARLIRLQCYEGLDVAHAVYEWNYPRQLLHIRAAQEGTIREEELFGPEYLIRRPLLEAIDSDEPVVLLIDEIDRADEEFEAFLLEVLSDFQITIPELGTIAARRRPSVILTSNRTRELHDALKRRALFHWIGHPSIEREIAIVRLRVPGIPERLASEAAAFVRELRGLDLAKPPGVAETIDWAMALNALGRKEIDAEVVQQTLGSVLKYREDIDAVQRRDAVAPGRGGPRGGGGGARSGDRGRRDRRPRGHVRPRAARGRAGGRPGPGRRRAPRARLRRSHASGGRLLLPPPDARVAARRARPVRSRLQRLVPARARAAPDAHALRARARDACRPGAVRPAPRAGRGGRRRARGSAGARCLRAGAAARQGLRRADRGRAAARSRADPPDRAVAAAAPLAAGGRPTRAATASTCAA